MSRPSSDEYAPYYAVYIDRVPDGDVCLALEARLGTTLDLLASIDDARAGHRYAQDKWSIKQLLGHVIDAERVFAVRCLHFARGAAAPLPSFDQDEFVKHGGFDRRPWAGLIHEFETLRRANLALFRSLDDESGRRRGIASDVSFSARSLPWIIAGHEIHHVEVLKDRYLG